MIHTILECFWRNEDGSIEDVNISAMVGRSVAPKKYQKDSETFLAYTLQLQVEGGLVSFQKVTPAALKALSWKLANLADELEDMIKTDCETPCP